MTLTPSVLDAERLLKLARAARLQRSSAMAPIEPVERGGALALSFAQQRLWFLERMGDLGSTYHIPTRLRLGRELDTAALRRALDAMVARHEALRTTFVEVEGEPVQRIAEESRFHLLEHDLGERPDAAAELRRLAGEEAGAPFDLEHGPLIRGRLVRLPTDDHVLLLTMHHIVSDGWSMEVLTRELGTLYDAFRRGEPDPLPPLPVQYADYAIWQRKWVDGEVLRRQAEYWKMTLSGVPELLELPTDRPRPARQDHAGGTVGIDLGEELTAGLKALGQRHGATLFMTLLAGWAAVLARLSGQDDVVVGTPSANRGRAEIKGLIGFFVNTLALRVDLAGSPTVAELLGQVRARSLGAQQNQDIPFEQVVELVRPARSLAHMPLFQVTFAWQNASEGRPELPGPRAGGVGPASQATAKFDLSLSLGEAGGRIAGSLTYATSLFEQATIERHLAYLRRVLEAMVADESQSVDRLPLLPESERRRVVEEWNRTEAEYPRDTCVHELFEARVERAPDAPAVVCGEEALSYAELNARANRLAHHLRALGVGPDGRVAICVERSLEMVVGVLGVLKAGGAWVPLDPGYPVERLRYMLSDSAPAVVLTQTSIAAAQEGLFAGMEAQVLALDAPAWREQPATNPERGELGPAHLAYVIYTSGSTGTPKGVMVAHRNVAGLVAAQARTLDVDAASRVLQFASFSFDASVFEMVMALCGGASLHLPSGADLLAGEALERAVARGRITHVTLPPAVLPTLSPDGGLASVRTMVLAGEALPEAAVKRWAGGRRMLNAYGPTEAAVWTTFHECRADEGGDPPIGRPIINARVYVLDGGGEPAPVGVAGELHIGGAGVARGYLGRPALTAERFVPDPFGREPGARLYRTGDLVRWRESAEVRECVSAGVDSTPAHSRTDALTHSRTAVLEFLGRADFQVKVRGFRIEPGEIEARLREDASVHEAVVVAREDVPGDRRLVAYYVGEAVEIDALRAHLSGRLPEHMVPAAYVRLEALPLTPNGKVDRRALPAPEGDAYARRGYEAPVGETEAALAEIWCELLKVEQVGRWDHFFELGGHSLLAVRVISRVRQVLDAEVGIADLFERPVLADLARAIGDAARTELPPIEPADRSAPLPLSFAQQRLWFLEQLGGLGGTYHMPTRLRLGRELDRAALHRALDAMLERHEALRTTFVEVEGEPVQRIAAESRFHLLEHDLGEHPDAAAELRRLAGEEAGAPFDLEQGPLIRGRLVRLSADDHVLLITLHHIVSDGWSMGVLTRELGTLYAAFRRGEENPLPPLPIQYADYAAWQRQWVDGEVLREQTAYWKAALTGAPELLELPADDPRPARQSHAGALAGVELDEAVTAGLKSLGRRHGTTLFMTVLAGWAAVLGRLSGQHDVVVGTPSANRGRAEIEGLIGFFVNTLALRVDLSGSPTVAELLGRVKARALGAQQHQDIPFEQVVELVQPARSLSHTPLFQVMFTWQNAPEGELELSGLAAPEPGPRRAPAAPAGAAARTTAKFDLSLALGEAGGRIVGSVVYATALFEQATIERHLAYLRRALEAMVADESQSVDRLPLLPEAERRLVVEEWNATGRAYPTDGLRVHDLFRAQAARTPHAVALSWRGERLTYAELARRANQIANALRRRGVGPEVRVGICLPRTPDLVVAMLGVLGAGGAYVPLDPAYPRERLGYMAEDAAVTLVITDSALADRLPEGAAALLLLDRDGDGIAAESADGPESGVLPGNLSHVIFTSGSTGRPKGVMIRHSSTVVLLHWLRENVTDEERSSVLFSTSINFDVSVAEIFGTLAWGGKLVLVENALELATLGEDVVHVSMVPSAAAELLRGGGIPPSVKTLNLGGEALPSALAQGLYGLETVEKVGNLYGPTEDTTYSTYYVVPRGAEQVLVGTPVANTRAYVLDAHLQPVPAGAVGELYLAGDGLSRGYANRPAMTAERFVPCPFGPPGARMYRVMDRVRWRKSAEVRECVSAGVGDSREAANEQRDQPPFTHALPHSRTHALEYLGRIDFQVKVRGYRIEPGEIEARLAEHPGVRAPVVLVREDAPGDRRLVAYYLGDEPVAVDALKAHLSDRLPGYMVPAAYVWMETYPLTPNGKVDRQALPAPEGDAYAAREYAAPVGETEEALAGIWAGVLGVERVGRHDNFFELGGHSLLAVRVISRVRQVLDAEVGIADLFERPVLADLARAIDDAARTELPPIEPVDRGGRLPLSFAQQRLWFLEQLGGLGDTYHIPMQLRFGGESDRAALRRALNAILERHEALRTTFVEVEGEPVQRIAEESRFHLLEHDLGGHPDAAAELRRLAGEEAGAPFDLEQGPLIRGRLVRMADDEHILLVTMHHIVSDGWSMEVLTRELGTLYAAFRRGEENPLPPLPIQYADYAAWQRQWVDGEVLREQTAYWKAALTGAPELLELPADDPRPARQSHAGALTGVELDEAVTTGLKSLGRRHGTTLFMTVLAGWAAVLGRLSGKHDVVVGTPSANRGRTEIEGLIGFFVNTLALRVDLAGSPSVAELLGRVKARALGAQQHQDIPFEQVVELVQPVRSLSHTPLFQVMFTWQNASEGRPELPGLRLGGVASAPSRVSSQATAKFDLSLSLGEAGGRIVGSVVYATALFEQATIERHLAYLRRALEAMVADESQSVDRLPLLPEAERQLVVEEWNATDAAYPRELCIHELFQAQVARAPDAAAVVFENGQLTYAELNARANRLAHHLIGRGVGPDARVAICVERGPAMVVGLLAILKAGGGYVPLDPGYPAERLRYMLHDSAPAAVLTQGSLEGVEALFAGVDVPVIDLEGAEWARCPAADPGRAGLTPGHLAYVIYTSGSTGTPKGVGVEHRSLANHTAWQAGAFGLGPDDTVLQRTSISFDASVWELWTTLAVGARLVLLSVHAAKDPGAIARVIEERGVTVVQFVPTLLQAVLRGLPEGAPLSPRLVFCGGEPLTEALVAEARARGVGEVVNLYGPTEATIDSTAYRCGDENRAPAIGAPVGNVRVYVLDRAGEPVPVGVAGELYVGGAGVARGYLNRPAVTAERFVADPFSGEPGARLYRTGDLGRWRPDGTIEFLGRNDFQVKIRGFRVELGEIEARLLEHPRVREAVVIAREDAAGDRRLVAYYTSDAVLEIEPLRAHLGARLPEHMVPAAYVHLEMLPLTPNGKLDRKALPAPEGDAFATRQYEAPVGEVEEALAGIWSELLGVEQVGRRDNFFELGGHSLLAVRVISRVRQVLGAEVGIADLFERPVLADLARTIEDAARTELPPIEPADRSAPLPLSFAQQRLWFMDRMEGTGSAYHVPTRMRLRGELDRDALVRTLDRIVARHEALRTLFAEVDGAPVQRIAPTEESPFHLTEQDLRRAAEPDAELRRLMADEARAPFDLARGPLIRGRLVQIGDDDHVLLITMHHIVSDGWSMGVLTRELGALYGAFRAGRPDPLPPLVVQYADYAVWQRRWMEGEVLRRQAEYWTQALAGVPELLELPADRPRPARQDFTGATVGLVLDEALSAALKELSRRHGTTLYMTLLAGWAAALSRLSGQDEVVVGTPTANRGREEIEGLIGFFVNMLPVRVALSGAPTVAALLARVKERALGAQHHQDIPFEQVVELVHPARSMAHAPLFQAMFTWQNAPGGGAGLPGLTLAPMGPAEPSDRSGAGPIAPVPSAQATANVDLSLALGEAGGRIAGSVTYAAALFERETVERWAGTLRRVLEGMVADETRRVDRLEIVPEDERRRMVEEWNRTEAVDPSETCVHALFEAQVERAPEAEAVVFEGERLTYAELNAAANRLARRLRAAGVGAEARVGVMLERSAELVVALLAVLKAGGAYLPLDPALPAARRAALAADAGAAVLVTREPALEGFAGTIVSPAQADGEDGDDLGLDVPAAVLAYVIYTSGSTGTPKGVGVAHAAAAAHCRAAAAAYGLTPADRVLQFAAVGFDVSLEQMLAPLAAGACVVMRGNEVPTPLELARQAAAQGLTVINPPTAYWHQLAADPDALELLARTVRLVIAGGEAMSPAAAREWASGPAAGVRLLNGYGPTETVVTCTAYDVPAALRDGAVHVPVGRPFGGRAAYVLDGRGEPAPLGVPGELCIGGVLARGYLGRPAATAQAFVPDPFSATPGARMYRTGDRARWLEESAEVGSVSADSRTNALTHSRTGVIEFLGRRDFQLKVRGYRIEPGEIEARLGEHPEVREAVVLAREDAPGEKRLVAYVAGGEAASAEALRAHLGAALPAYMVPSAFVRLDAFPLTPTGKVDRRALPAPEAPAARTYEAPVGETEEALAEIFAEVLGVDRVGRHDNFFELGGHSLLVVQVVSRMRQVLGVEAPLAHLFSHPTVESLAARLAGTGDGHRSDRAIAIRPSGSQPPLFLVHEGAGSIAYAQVLHPHVGDDIPVYALPAPPADAPLRTVEAMATRLVRMIREVQPSGPYRVAGWSFGGVLAYEVASQLIGRDEIVEFVGMLDSYHPVRAGAGAHDVAQEHALLLHVLRMAETVESSGRVDPDEADVATGDVDLETFVTRCREQGLLPGHVTVEEARRMRDRLRNHQRALRAYSPQPLPVAVHLFPARQSADPEPSRGWRATLSATRLRVTPVPGTHLSMMQAPNAATLGAALSHAVGRAREEAAPRPAAGGRPW